MDNEYMNNSKPVTEGQPVMGNSEQTSMNQGVSSEAGNMPNNTPPIDNSNGFVMYGQAPNGGTQTPPGSGKDKKVKKTKTKKSGFVKKAALLVASAAVFGLVAGGVMQGVDYVSDKYITKSGTTPEISTTKVINSGSTSSSTSVAGTTVADVAASVMPSIVSITSTTTQTYSTWFDNYSRDVEGSGSGIIIGKDDTQLFIATNYHVIQGAKALSVGFADDSSAEAIVKGYDEDADLAVVSVSLSNLQEGTVDKIAVATIGDSDGLVVGDNAIAIGNALGYGQSVTVGYISAVNRTVDLQDKTMTLLQTDAAINPGNSGGALLNTKGEVIGINTVKFVDSTVEGMGYAIPISDAIPIINRLVDAETVSEEEQAYLGIQGKNVDDDTSKAFNMPNGIYVSIVAEDSPAEQYGIVAGDIIVGMNDEEVLTMERLQNVMASTKAGTDVTIKVMRKDDRGNYQEKNVSVTLGKRSDAVQQ